MKTVFYLFICFSLSVCAVEFTGPSGWQLVNTNVVEVWQAKGDKLAGDDFLAFKGVVADKKKMEVRFLAEAVGHTEGTTTEFMLVGPRSDRAYESLGVTVSSPEKIVKAVEFLGVRRGRCIDARKFHFVPCGERFRFFIRRVDVKGAQEMPVSSLLKESNPDDPMLSDKGFVFAGGDWDVKDGRPVCNTSTVPPCSVISLYNELSVFDIPWQAGQSAVYGRLAVKENLPYGALLEFIARPVSRESTVLPVEITVLPENEGIAFQIKCDISNVDQQQSIKESVQWLRSLSDGGKDIFLTVNFDDDLSVAQAVEAAALFEIISDSGVTLYGKGEAGVYYKAFLPQDAWRKREGRNPQPFEVHVTRQGEEGLKKKLVFIEEDWNVKGIDPKLNPKDYPFKEWSELKPLVEKAGGKNNKVAVLFFFVPHDMKLAEFMPGIDSLSKRLPLVHIFSE